MTYWRLILRFLAGQELLPALAATEQEALIGGQAVFEGVMMRSPHAWGIAVRKPTGEMAIHSEPLERPSDKHHWMSWPFIRGLVTLGQAMKLGFRASKFSINILIAAITPEKEQSDKMPEMSKWTTALTMIFSIGFFIVMYKLVPLTATQGLARHLPLLGNNILFNLVDGIFRLVLFVLLIWGLSLMPDMRRLFEYHGAEHKTVFAYEAQSDIPNMEFTHKFFTYHPRCGTSFLMTIMLISIVIYAAVPVAAAAPGAHFFGKAFWLRFGLRILLLPVIASISYAVLRFSPKHGQSPFAQMTR